MVKSNIEYFAPVNPNTQDLEYIVDRIRFTVGKDRAIMVESKVWSHSADRHGSHENNVVIYEVYIASNELYSTVIKHFDSFEDMNWWVIQRNILHRRF